MKLNWTPKIKLNASGVAVMSENPGIYKLWYLNPRTNSHTEFFTGKSANLKKDLALHLPWRERNKTLSAYLKKYQCYFQIVEIEVDKKDMYPKKSIFQKIFNNVASIPSVTINYR